MNHKKVITIFIILSIIFTVLGGTLAYWSWSSTNAQKTLITFTVTPGMTCSADGGGNITNSTMLAPSTCTDTNYALIRPITVSTTTSTTNEIINVSMNLHVDSISQELLDSDYFMYAITTSSSSCDDPIQGGSFGDMLDNQTSTVPLLINEEFVGTESKTYYLYIWLDEAETNLNTMNKSFSMSLEGSCSDTGSVFKKNYANFGGYNSYFKNTSYINNITSVSFVNEINIPGNAIMEWNIGTSPSNADDVKAWLEDAGNDRYALKIGSNGTVFSNNLSYALYGLTNASNFDFSSLNTSETTDMSWMFSRTGYNATNFNLNLGTAFNVSNVTSAAYMFSGVGRNSTNFSLDLGSNFDTSEITNMVGMFSEVGTRSEDFRLNLGTKFNTSKVTNMANMFYSVGCTRNGFNLDLGSNFNTSNVRNMVGMFRYACSKAANWNLNLGTKFNTVNVTNMSNMFNGIGSSSNVLNLSLELGNNFDTSNVIAMYSMFGDIAYWANNVSLNLGNKFDTSKVNDMRKMFTNLGTYDEDFNLELGNKFNTSHVIYMSAMFSGTGWQANNYSLNLGDKFYTSNVTDMASMFETAAVSATNVNINLGNHFNTTKVTNMYAMFYGFGQSAVANFYLDMSAGDFSNVTNNVYMLNGFAPTNGIIYVKDATAQQWIINGNSDWGTSFSASNVLIK